MLRQEKSGKDGLDQESYQKLSATTKELFTLMTALPEAFMEVDKGYATPKVASRSVVFNPRGAIISGRKSWNQGLCQTVNRSK